MRAVSGSAQTILGSSNPSGVAFIEIGFTSGTQRLTTASDSINWSGQLWVGLGGLLAIELPRETNTTEVAGGRLRLSGVPSSEISKALTESVYGRPITIWFGVMSEALALIDVPEEFVGRLNRYTFRRSSPYSELELSFESELAVMRRPRVRRLTQADQVGEYPGDTYFSHLNRTKELMIRFPTAEAQRR